MRRALPVLAIGLALGVTSFAGAKDKDEKPAKGGAAKGITPYDQQIVDAHKAFSAGLAGGALDEGIAGYRKAIALDPQRPEGHLFLGGALYQKGDYAGAEEALNNAANRAKADKAYTNLQGKALFLLATVKEAAGKPEEAKTAWKAYEDFAKDNPDQPFPPGSGDAPPMAVKVYAGSAMERQNKLETYAKSVTEYAKVKELILKRQKELGIEPTVPKAK
ncbi:MAG: tetratricopeptide repeat protein [Polyangiales bacterium]